MISLPGKKSLSLLALIASDMVIGVEVVGQGDTGSPGSGGASPYRAGASLPGKKSLSLLVFDCERHGPEG
jgi:hypothetical protein